MAPVAKAVGRLRTWTRSHLDNLAVEFVSFSFIPELCPVGWPLPHEFIESHSRCGNVVPTAEQLAIARPTWQLHLGIKHQVDVANHAIF